MITIRSICLLVVVGAANANAQVSPSYPLSGLNGLGNYYNGYQSLGHLGYSGQYPNLGYHHGSYLPSSNYGRVPLSFNGAVPLGYAGHGGAAALNGYGYNPGYSYGAYNGAYNGAYGYNGGYSGFGSGLGYNSAAYPYHHGGVVGGGYGYEGYANPDGVVSSNYRVARLAPKVTQTSNELVINHGNTGSSRQFFNRVDKN